MIDIPDEKINHIHSKEGNTLHLQQRFSEDHKLATTYLRRKTNRKDDDDFFQSSKFAGHEIVKETKDARKTLCEAFNTVSPLIYMSSAQKNDILEEVFFIKTHSRYLLYKDSRNSNEELSDRDSGNYVYILLEGEIHVLDEKDYFKESLKGKALFGFHGPIFEKRISTMVAEKDSLLAVIKPELFLRVISPFSKFACFITKAILYKDKLLDDLSDFKSFILGSFNKGPIDLKILLEKYKKLNSCLHPLCHSNQVDFNAWSYSINRLPENLFHSYVYILLNKDPKLACMDDEIQTKYFPRIFNPVRARDIYAYPNGKNVIRCREMESDVLDFMSNICIHLIEASKIRQYIKSPYLIKRIHEQKGDIDKVIEVVEEACEDVISKEDRSVIKKTWGEKFGEDLISVALHFQDYSIKLHKFDFHDQDPAEQWIQNLWIRAKKLLGVQSSVDEIEDLVVDLMQGSKRTLLFCLSPHRFKHRKEILKWAKENKIKTNTKKFLSETDRLIALSYYYYKAFPDKKKEMDSMQSECGIDIIEETFATGVQVLLINVNKLDPQFLDPAIEFKPSSKNHLILHIGYTFGAQSALIIKPVLMLFGSKARSLNIIGKAGGLTGSRTDILVANKMFYDKTHELIPVRCGEVNVKELEKTTGSAIHLGPMLCVAGTILQNNDLLRFYKYVNGCIGLEMEGFFYVDEVDKAIKNDLISDKFLTRCFYYSSDLPLDPTQNLSMEGGNIDWNEGVGSMNAIQRYILNQIFTH